MFLIDRITYSNGFKKVHPAEKLIFAAGGLLFLLLTENPVMMSALFIFISLIIIYGAGVSCADYIKLLSVPLIFILSGAVTVAVEINSSAGNNLWLWNLSGLSFSISAGSVLSGGILFLRSTASVSCFYFFILTTPVTDVEYILKQMKLPVLFREMFMMIYRFIFVTSGMADRIVISQRSRGGYSTFGNRLNSIALLASSVFVKSYFFSRASYNAMQSRGCEGSVDVIDSSYSFSIRNIIIVLLFNLIFLILIVRFG